MYLSWREQTITDFSNKNLETLYSQGYVFTRKEKGVMHQTRSLRIDLSKFQLSSENRRILRNTQSLNSVLYPIPYTLYHWSIGKLAKDFYETKFGKGTFSANKTKELMTDATKSNFNCVFVYSVEKIPIGYCIALETNELIHYSYPFYDLNAKRLTLNASTGLGMMLRAVLIAKEQKKRYIYIGSATRPTDTYKLQFSGLEWWNGERWERDLPILKTILSHRI